ncbi:MULTISPECIES: DUF885 family protein [Acidobacteriaceae]|uniref:DUF885 domain-containing protein n=1 Tax=Acidobacteriaceae TaxID=204434 RepID=UPI00131ADA7F|nr:MULTISPECIES: DUF885 domain-containing protein [Acidobacteriaceae]MDW5265350.1 DUF885 domain-containing protein [Edaphobacter sp.]
MKKISLAGGLALMCCINAVPSRAQIVSLPTAMAANASVADRSKALNALFDEIWQDKLKHSPEYASYLGDKRYNDQLTDYSVQAVNASLARGRGYIEKLGMIDTTSLPDQEKLSADLMMRSLIDDQEAAKFKEWEMPVNQFSGFHTDLAQMPNDLPFDTVKDYDDYIARLQKVPTAFSQITTNMQMGIDDGRMPPEYLLEKVLVQVQTLADQKPEDSPFALPLKKFPKTVSAADQKRITSELLNAIATDVLPSYQRFAKFMKVDYVPKGRKDPGAWALPDGDAYYAFRIRQSTTLNKTATEIHQIGLDEVKRDEAEMLAIVHKLGFADLKSFNEALKTNPKEHPTSKEQLLEAYRGYIAQMQPKLPELFGTLPKAKLEVVEMPSYIAKDQAEAFYDQGSADGKRPGKVDVNTYNFAERSLAGVEAVAYHEGIPGHHLQISIGQELTGLPEFRKQAYYTAYTEGWALYSERLGKEIGFYQDPYSDYGRLEADIWRAIRLVVDTGVHSQHWTRQQMIDYFHEHTAMDDTNIQAEVDRYIAWPGQALGYKMGQLKILELRDRAKTALGPKFDIKAFHDEVLDSGALPMDVLDQRVNDWIAAQKK